MMTKFLERNYKSVSWILGLLFLLYIFSMFIYPWFRGGWEHVHAVWYDWQGLNVGLLAFAATVILFNISRYQANLLAKRELIAIRAFFPEALSELSQYCKDSAQVLGHLHKTFCAKENKDMQKYNRLRDYSLELPLRPARYREIFSRFISLADPELSEYLAYILICMQKHNSRMSSMYDAFKDRGKDNYYSTSSSILWLIHLSELHQLINNLFDYARFKVDTFTRKALTLDSFDNSIMIFELDDLYLESMTMAKSVLESSLDTWRLRWPD